MIMALALLGSAAIAAGNSWILNSDTVMTEKASSGTPWILAVEIKNSSEIWIKSVTQVGSSTELDFSGAIEGAEGKVIYSINGFREKKTVTSVVLPNNLKRLEAEAFTFCEGLTTVTPLLPDSLEFFGCCAFSGCIKLGGDVVFPATATSLPEWKGDQNYNGGFCGTQITSCDFSQTTMAIPGRCFLRCTKLQWVKLPQGVKEIPDYCFRSNESLTNIIPFLPATVTWIGQESFMGCSNLKIDLKLASNEEIYFSGSRAFRDAAIRSVEITAPQTYLGYGTKESGSGYLFECLRNCGQIVLPKEVTRVKDSTFYYCSSLTNLVFQGNCPQFDDNAFADMGNGLTRIFIPRFDDTWNVFLEDSRYTPIENWSAAVTNGYLSKYPNDIALPLGSFEVGGKRYWVSDIIPWQQKKVVHVDGFPVNVDSAENPVAPSYGCLEGFEDGETRVFTAPATASFDGGHYRCVGYALSFEQTPGKRDFSVPVTNLSTTCSITQTDGRVWHLLWLWESDSYTVAVTKINGHMGEVAVTPATGSGYAPGAVVTLTATGTGGGQFVRWVGDVPAGCETDSVISITVDSSKNVQAIFSGAWTYDMSDQTITDGNWVLKVSPTAYAENALAVSSVQSVENEIFLDLGQIVKSSNAVDHRIVEISDDVFHHRAIRFLVLGENIMKIQKRAFRDCAELESVKPLLPRSLVRLGQGAFSQCQNLVGDVVFPANEIDVNAPSADGYHEVYLGWFYGTKISSCDISEATMDAIVTRSFSACKNLKTVKLPKGLVQIGVRAFYESSALTTVDPFLPKTIERIEDDAFCGCSSLASELVLEGDNLVSIVASGSRGAFSGCSSLKSAKILQPVEDRASGGTVGSSEGVFPRCLFSDCSSLENVEIGKGVTDVGSRAFLRCGNLKDVKFLGQVPLFNESGDFGTFWGVADKKVRFHVSKAEPTWNDFRAERVTPMNENLIAQWESVYPGEAKPKGQFTLSSKKMWLCQDFGLAGIYMFIR